MLDLATVTPDELQQALYKLAHECYEADKAYINADEEFQMLDDAAKPFKSVKMDSFDAKSYAEKERLFYASMDYVEWLTGYQAARKKRAEARVERDNKARLFDTCRSILSSKNKEWARV